MLLRQNLSLVLVINKQNAVGGSKIEKKIVPCLLKRGFCTQLLVIFRLVVLSHFHAV